MNAHRFTLEKYKTPSSRHTCPECGKPRQFTRYIDAAGQITFPEHVGKCNREINCGYHFPPRDYFTQAGISFDKEGNIKANNLMSSQLIFLPKSRPAKPPTVAPSFFPTDIFRASLTIGDYAQNRFYQFLQKRFGTDIAASVTGQYFIGNSSHYAGATVFWQIDIRTAIRSGKIILYDERGHRVHGRQNWMHRVLSLPDFQLCQCFFGEHLLPEEPDKVVAVVESEKTAVLASIYFAHLNYTWLACGGLNMLTAERCQVLQGRKIVLFPDTGKPAQANVKTPFERWSETANELRTNGFHVVVSDLLERHATDTEKAEGCDLADILLRFDLEAFKRPLVTIGSPALLAKF